MALFSRAALMSRTARVFRRIADAVDNSEGMSPNSGEDAMINRAVATQNIERWMPKSEGARIAAAVATAVILGILIAMLMSLKG